MEEIFALKYRLYFYDEKVCSKTYDGRFEIEEIERMERFIEENGVILEIAPLTEADLKNMRFNYSFAKEEMEYVIRLFSR